MAFFKHLLCIASSFGSQNLTTIRTCFARVLGRVESTGNLRLALCFRSRDGRRHFGSTASEKNTRVLELRALNQRMYVSSYLPFVRGLGFGMLVLGLAQLLTQTLWHRVQHREFCRAHTAASSAQHNPLPPILQLKHESCKITAPNSFTPKRVPMSSSNFLLPNFESWKMTQ